MKFASGNEKQALQQLDPNFMSDEEDGEDPAGTWIVRSPAWRSPQLSSMLHKLQEKIDGSPLCTPRIAEFEGHHVPALHHPLHQHGQCVLMTEKQLPVRGPHLRCQQLHPVPNLLQSTPVETKLMKI